MPDLVQIAIVMIASLAGLVWSAHFFVGGGASLARHLGMRPGLIGLTIVAFGTSAPEIVVSADSAIEGAPELGVGNAIGSNIANIGLVLGVSCLITRLPVDKPLFKLEIPLLIFATTAAFITLFDGALSRSEGLLLLCGALMMPFVLIFDPRKEDEEEAEEAFEEEIPQLSKGISWLWLLGGLIALLVSSEFLVRSATDLAILFGVSPMIVGLTVVALGTSLPELAASVASLMKGHSEMAIGNIIGSNILNILAVMSLPGVIMPSVMSGEIFSRDVMTMTGLTVLLLAVSWIKIYAPFSGKLEAQHGARPTPTLGRPIGIVFLLIYLAYYAHIFATH